MFKTSNKAEAIKELERIDQDIEKSLTTFNTLRAIPIILCMEDAVSSLFIAYAQKVRLNTEYKPEDRDLAVINFIIEWNQFLNTMLVGIINKGFYDSTTKFLASGVNIGLSIEKNYNNDVQILINQLREQGLIGKKYIIRLQERTFLGRYPGIMFFVLSDDTDKKVVQNIDKILELRQLLYKKGLLNTMIHLAPKGTEIEFNEKGTYIKYPENFTFEKAYQKIGLSHRLIESFTPTTYWNSHLANEEIETLKVINEGKGKNNIDHLKLEHEEIYKNYSKMSGFPETFEKTYGITLETFLGILDELIFRCYPNDNTLGYWKLNEVENTKIWFKTYNPTDVKKVVHILSNQDKKNSFYGLIVLNDAIFTTFIRLAKSRFFILERCFDEVYENDLKGKNFENACRKLLKEKGFRVLPQSIEIFEPMLSHEIAYNLWGKEKNRTDLDIIAIKGNSLLIIECKDIKFQASILHERNKFKNYVIEQYYRVDWINNNFEKFKDYIEQQCTSLGIDLTQKLFIFPLVVSNTLVNIEGFEGAPLITYSELENLVSKDWNIKNDDSSGELKIEINGRLHNLPWFTNASA